MGGQRSHTLWMFYGAGGRGKDGAPIITFPECSGFSEVTEEDFVNVTTYLTSIPRYPTASLRQPWLQVLIPEGTSLPLQSGCCQHRLHHHH